MVHRACFSLAAAAAVLTTCWINPPQAAAKPKDDGRDLFTNYYAPAGSPAGVTAALYPAPRPTPPLVGHTYVTYPPLLPQEFLYKHWDLYRTKHCDGSVTWTRVSYNHRPFFGEHKPTVMWGLSTPCTPPVKAPTVFCMP
jgi:hypothetical protein